MCLHGKGGVEPVQTFFGQGRGSQFFAILCERLLRSASYDKMMYKKNLEYTAINQFWYMIPYKIISNRMHSFTLLLCPFLAKSHPCLFILLLS